MARREPLLVKAVIVLKPELRDKVTAEEIFTWSRTQMAAYKAPRKIQFTDALPRSGTGKIQWRALQEKEFT
jgi:fatty-acyl-CoA synthase